MAKKETEVRPGGGKDGERDPLTLGVATHGEDIKGNSTHDQDTAEVVKSAAKSQELSKDQRVADAKAKKVAKAKA